MKQLLLAIGAGLVGYLLYRKWSDSSPDDQTETVSTDSPGGQSPPTQSPPPTPDAGYSSDAGYVGGQRIDLPLQSIGGGFRLVPEAAQAFVAMRAAAIADGVNLVVTSAFRTISDQSRMAASKGLYGQGGLASRPGYSPHQRGVAVDIEVGANNRLDAPGTNDAYRWLMANASSYGFYRDDRESWHWQTTSGDIGRA